MVDLNLTLPENLNAWVEKQARSGRFDNVEAYIENLLLRERDRQKRLAEFETLVAEGIDSGVSDRSVDDILKEARGLATGRLNAGI